MIAVSSSLAYCQHSQHSPQHVTYTATLPEKEESTVVVSPLTARVDLTALRPIFNRRPDTCIDSRSGNWTARCHYRSCLEKLASECVAFCSASHRLPVEKATDCRFYLYRLAIEKVTDSISSVPFCRNKLLFDLLEEEEEEEETNRKQAIFWMLDISFTGN